MTRDEIEAEVRAIGRTCRGPRDQNAARVVQRLAKGGHPQAGPAVSLGVTLGPDAATDELLRQLFARGAKASAAAVDEAARQGCGSDINALILAHPLDGEPKEAPCPSCGTVIRWTPARYETPAAS